MLCRIQSGGRSWGILRKPNELDDKEGHLYEPQRYPSYAFFGKASSMLFCEDSCAEGKVTRFCHSGNGRSCYRPEHRACPEYWRNCQHIYDDWRTTLKFAWMKCDGRFGIYEPCQGRSSWR